MPEESLARYLESVSKKAQPDESLNQPHKVLPLQVETRKDTWKLKEGIQFLNVADGIDEFYNERKTYNDAEVEAVDALVLSLLKAGIPAKSINVLTPYRAQWRKLKAKARMSGWFHVGCLGTTTRDSSDSSLRVMILSLVNTPGLARFLGARPALEVRIP